MLFGTRCHRRIMGYHWYDFVSNQRLFREVDYTSIIRYCQLRLYGFVARYPEADHVYRVVFERDNPT